MPHFLPAWQQQWRQCASHPIPLSVGIMVAALLAVAVLFPQALNDGCEVVNNWVYQSFGGFYLYLVAAMLILAAFLALTPLGGIRIGNAGEKPAFDSFSWFAMLFCAGMGTGFLFWGGAEPLYHFQHPPLIGADPRIQAFAVSYFHWGLSPWVIYGLTAAAVGYFCSNKQLPLKFSYFLNCSKSWQQFLIDGFMILALVFGIAATFGMGVLMIEAGLCQLFHMAPGLPLKLSIMGLMTALFLLSAYRGLSQGIRLLSNISIALTLALLLVMAWFIPKVSFLQDLNASVGLYLQQLPQWSVGRGEFQPANWPQLWTVKYWSWWLAWAPFVGSFIAVISRGRTIRQILVGSVVAPTLLSIVWFFVMGGAAMDWVAHLPASQAVMLDNAQQVWFSMLDYHTHSFWLALFTIVMIGIFVCDSLDSACFTLGCLTQSQVWEASVFEVETNASENSNSDIAVEPSELKAKAEPAEPPFSQTLYWGLILCVLTMTLLMSGGIEILQQVTPIMVLPFSILLLGVLGRFVWQVFCQWQQERLTSIRAEHAES